MSRAIVRTQVAVVLVLAIALAAVVGCDDSGQRDRPRRKSRAQAQPQHPYLLGKWALAWGYCEAGRVPDLSQVRPPLSREMSLQSSSMQIPTVKS